MVEYIWGIVNLERELSDGYVFKVDYSICARRNDIYVNKIFSIDLDRPEAELIPYEDLTEELVVQWVKDKVDPEFISNEQAELLKKVQERETPKVGKGLPWAPLEIDTESSNILDVVDVENISNKLESNTQNILEESAVVTEEPVITDEEPIDL